MKILHEFIKRHLKKSRKKIYNYNYREKNKVKNKKNRVKILKRKKEYREKNRDRLNKKKRDWNKKNNEKTRKWARDWRKKNPKKARINNWKQMGLISDNYDLLYDKWKNTKNCENCKVELTDGNKGSTKRCLDHSHITGEFRNILCQCCNVRRGETNI